MKKKGFFLFFYLPLLGMALILLLLSSFNRRYISDKVETLVNEQLEATAEILKVNIGRLLEEGFSTDKVFDLYSSVENIYFMAFLNKDRSILDWSSRFEGYLPLSEHSIDDEGSWIIESPVGRIFNFFSSFKTSNGELYYLYLGYSLQGLEEMMLHSRRNSLFLFGMIVTLGVIFFFGLFRIQRHYLFKEKEAEKEKKEKERFREISALTSAVAHEIKNPLNSLALMFELLHRKVPDGLKDDVVVGNGEIRKISRIIDRFSFSLKPLELKKENVSLKTMFEDVGKALQNDAKKRNLEIRSILKKPLEVEADKDLLYQALINLVRNSLGATEPGGGEIRISGDKIKKNIVLAVQDTGKGITEADRESVFAPFFSTEKKGMGIGLYLTKKIINAHNGEISFKSEVGKGTIFYIKIPGGGHE